MIIIYNEADGRVTQVISQQNAELIAHLESEGVAFYVLGSDPTDLYMDLKGAEPRPALRPELGDIFPSLNLGPDEVTTARDIPACSVAVTGPVQQGFFEHPGGDLQIRFLIPGEYLIGLEPFPFRRREFKFIVRSENPAAAAAAAESSASGTGA